MRLARSVAVVAALVAGCSPNRPLTPPGRGAGGAGGPAGAGGTAPVTQTIRETLNRKLDLLFVIDDSPSSGAIRQKFISNAPAFFNVLAALPPGMPDLHIGVVSADLGAGAFLLPGCPAGGDGGRLLAGRGAACRGSIAGTYLMVGESSWNYQGTLNDSFACLADIGSSGCAFGQPLAAAALALGASGPAPPENLGFLRSDAFLAIVVVTNQDDCSVPAGSTLFDPASRALLDPLGPLTSYRCAEYGYLCRGAAPPRTTSETFGPADCVPAENAGRLSPVGTLIRQIQSLKADPAQLFVSVVSGPPDPFSVTQAPAPAGSDGSGVSWPSVGRSCEQNDGSFGTPGIRLRAFTDAMTNNGLFQTACANSFAPALTQVATVLGRVPGPLCLDSALVEGAAAGELGAGCTVTELVPVLPAGAVLETELSPCALGGGQICWAVESNGDCPASGAAITVNRASGDVARVGSELVVTCPR